MLVSWLLARAHAVVLLASSGVGAAFSVFALAIWIALRASVASAMIFFRSATCAVADIATGR